MTRHYIVEFRITAREDVGITDAAPFRAIAEVCPWRIASDGDRYKQVMRDFDSIDKALRWVKLKMEVLRAEQQENGLP